MTSQQINKQNKDGIIYNSHLKLYNLITCFFSVDSFVFNEIIFFFQDYFTILKDNYKVSICLVTAKCILIIKF